MVLPMKGTIFSGCEYTVSIAETHWDYLHRRTDTELKAVSCSGFGLKVTLSRVYFPTARDLALSASTIPACTSSMLAPGAAVVVAGRGLPIPYSLSG